MAGHALVTGAGTGIGRGIALELARAGWDVGLHYCHSDAGAAGAAEEIRALGRRAELFRADLGSVEEIRALFAAYRERFGTLELFVNNAGITKKADFLSTTPELFEELCAVDFRGAFFCLQSAARLMTETGVRGSMVVISSNNAYAHFADVSVYGSVKAAVGKLTEHAAIELAQYGIRVNSIAPGWTDTGAARLDAKEETYYKVPLQRWTTPQEIGKAVLYLAGDGAASITGAHLVIDGGALLVSDKAYRYGYHA